MDHMPLIVSKQSTQNTLVKPTKKFGIEKMRWI